MRVNSMIGEVKVLCSMIGGMIEKKNIMMVLDVHLVPEIYMGEIKKGLYTQ